MAANLKDNILKCIFSNEKQRIAIQISLKLVTRIPIDNEPALLQVMTWRRTGDKPLLVSMVPQFTDALNAALWGDELTHEWNGPLGSVDWKTVMFILPKMRNGDETWQQMTESDCVSTFRFWSIDPVIISYFSEKTHHIDFHFNIHITYHSICYRCTTLHLF